MALLILIMPIGLNQLFLIIWLIAKGFDQIESFKN